MSSLPELNEAAKKLAREYLAAKFMDLSSLDDIGRMRVIAQKELILADAQLNRALNNKLDALKRGIDISADSNEKLRSIASKLTQTDARIATTNTDVSHYRNLRRLHYARDNLAKVRAQVEFFARVPERVLQLQQQLEKSPESLKLIFLESIRLEALADGLYESTKQQTNITNISSPDTSTSKIEGYGGYGDYASRSGSRMSIAKTSDAHVLHTLNEQLRVVPELSKQVISVLWSNIARLFEVAIQAPANLVETFEVIEMYDEYMDRREKQVGAPGAGAGTGTGTGTGTRAPNKDFSVRLKGDAKWRLEKYMFEKVESSFALFTEINGDDDDSDDSSGDGRDDAARTRAGEERAHAKRAAQVKDTLGAANQLLQTLTIFKNEVSPCIPPAYGALELFVETLEKKIEPAIETLVGPNIALFDVSELLVLVDWLEYFVAQFRVFGCVDRKICEKFNTLSTDLMHEYLHRIKKQVLGWFDNIKKEQLNEGDERFRQTREGFLVTSAPEDMFNILHLQIAVAKDKLPREHLQDVVNACIQVLREVQRGMYDSIVKGWSEMSCEELAAAVNDNQRLQEKCEEFSLEVEEMVPQENFRLMLLAMLEDVSSEYINLAVTAVRFLAKLILLDLEKPVLNVLFTKKWQSGNERLGAVTVTTLDDYYQDVVKWLPPYFFAKFCKEMLSLVVTSFASALAKRQKEKDLERHMPGSSSFIFTTDNLTVAKTLMADQQELEKFFNKYIDYTRGIDVQEELNLLTCLVQIIASQHTSSIRDQVQTVFKIWETAREGDDQGLKIVQTALSARQNQSKDERLAAKQWVNEQYSEFREDIEQDRMDETSDRFTAIGQSADALIRAYEEPQQKSKGRLAGMFTMTPKKA